MTQDTRLRLARTITCKHQAMTDPLESTLRLMNNKSYVAVTQSALTSVLKSVRNSSSLENKFFSAQRLCAEIHLDKHIV